MNKAKEYLKRVGLIQSPYISQERVIKHLEAFANEQVKAITVTRCCETLKDKETMYFDEVKHLENKHNVLNKVLDKKKDDFKLQIFENGKWIEVPL